MLQRRMVLFGALATAACGVARAAADYQVLAWSTLVPPGWDGRQLLAGLALDGMSDGDPEAREAMKKLRKLWDAAPVNPALHQQRVRLSGFLVPLEFGKDVIREFLLVPYFGACIHEPAPPANQVVHVLPLRPVTAAERGTSAVTVSGTLTVVRAESDMAVSAYRLQADSVVPYKP
jgi:hypothetical protein